MKKWILTILTVSITFTVSHAQTTSKPTSNTTEVVVSADTNTGEVSVAFKGSDIVVAEGIIYNDGKNAYVSADVQFAINATDEGSGVKNIFVTLDQDETFDYLVTGDAISIPEEGKHIISYRVVDNVGNSSLAMSYQFIVDATSPEIKLSTVQDAITIDDITYLAPYHEIKLSAYDRLSGVASIEYSVDDGDFVQYNSAKVSETGLIGGLDDGEHVIKYRATDNVGNVSVEELNYSFFVDSVAPTVEISVTPDPYVASDGTIYLSSDSLIFIDAEDAETDVDTIMVKVDDGDWEEYDFAFFLDGGDHIVTAKATDLSGNESEEVTLEVTVDSDTPEGDIIPIK